MSPTKAERDRGINKNMRMKNVDREKILVMWGFGTSGILRVNR